MLFALIGGLAWGRAVVHEGPRATSDLAFYVLDGLTTCLVTVVVGPDGVPLDAKREGCPAVLEPALTAAAMRWRWAPAPATTAEQVEIPIRPPAFTPRPSRHPCFAAFEVRGTRPSDQTAVRGRCAIEASEVPSVSTDDRPRTAWCVVDVAVDRSGQATARAAECADGFAAAAVAGVSGWAFAGPGAWRILVGYVPAQTGILLDFD